LYKTDVGYVYIWRLETPVIMETSIVSLVFVGSCCAICSFPSSVLKIIVFHFALEPHR
jgi:hypothetical protein